MKKGTEDRKATDDQNTKSDKDKVFLRRECNMDDDALMMHAFG